MFEAVETIVIPVTLYPAKKQRAEIPELPIQFTEDNVGTELRFVFTDETGSIKDVDGSTVTLYFIRPDETTVLVPCTVSGNVATVAIPEDCIYVHGRGKIFLRITKTENDTEYRKVVWAAECSIMQTVTDSLADPTGTIPSLSELLAQIERLENLHDNNVKGYYSSLTALENAQPDPYPGDLYGVGSGGSYTYYIFDGVSESWKNLGDIFAANDVYVDRSSGVTIGSFGGTAKVVQHGTSVHVEYTSNLGVTITWDDLLLTVPAEIYPSAAQHGVFVYGNRSDSSNLHTAYGTVTIGTNGQLKINLLELTSQRTSTQVFVNFWYEL